MQEPGYLFTITRLFLVFIDEAGHKLAHLIVPKGLSVQRAPGVQTIKLKGEMYGKIKEKLDKLGCFHDILKHRLNFEASLLR